MHPGVLLGLELLKPILRDILPNRGEAQRIEAELTARALALDTVKVQAQASVLGLELSGTWLQRNWRPLMMFLFGGVILYSQIVVPVMNALILPWLTHLWNATPWAGSAAVPALPSNTVPDQVWGILEWAIPGYIGTRGIEKVATVLAGNDASGGSIISDVRERIRPSRRPPVRHDVDIDLDATPDVPGQYDDFDIPRGAGR